MRLDDFTGTRVLVSAAASGIGATIASRFAAAGADVYICDADEDALQRYLVGQPGSPARWRMWRTPHRWTP